MSYEKATSNPYLCISNNGVAPYEALTILGITSTRYREHPLFIGQFGSGAKHAIALLLRIGIHPIIYCGKTKLTFTTEPRVVNGREYLQSVCNIAGQIEVNGKTKSVNKTERMGFVLDFGSLEWTSTYMALREFISNALDASLANALDNPANNVLPHTDVAVYETCASAMRADAEKTQVFIPVVGSDLQEFVKKLPEYFLHFGKPLPYASGRMRDSGLYCKPNVGDNFEEYAQRILKVVNDNPQAKKPKIYRKGVFVGNALTDTVSLFHYNFGTDLVIDESRNIRDYEAKACAAKSVYGYNVSQFKELIKSAIKGNSKWEHTFSSFNVVQGMPYQEEERRKVSENIKAAFTQSLNELNLPEDSIACNLYEEEKLKARGFDTVSFSCGTEMLIELLSATGMKVGYHYLTKADKNNLTALPPTKAVVDMCGMIRGIFNDMNLYIDVDMPRLSVFVQPTTGGIQSKGLYELETDTVYIESSIADVMSAELFKTCMEEMIHALSKTKDFTRDFQEVLLSVLHYQLKLQGKV